MRKMVSKLNKYLVPIILVVFVVSIAVAGFLAYQQTRSNSTGVARIDCDVYDEGPGSRGFQTSYEKIRNQAEISFHGEDKKGKDGPMAKMGLDLARLYHEYQAFQCSGSEGSFESQVFAAYRMDDGIIGPVRDESIVGDFTASEDTTGQELASDLRRLGATNVAGPIEGVKSNAVSATMPIDKIPKVAQLDSVRSFMPAVAMTNSSAEDGVSN